MDHSELIAELSEIEKMTPAERIALARERRRLQLKKCDEREKQLAPPPPRRPRLKFSAEVALLEATGRADATEVERLLLEGANPNSHNEDGLTPLHQCAIDNNEQILRLLLRHGADVNAQDTEQWTPLHAAACCAHIDIVRLLIDNGADLLAVNADGNMPYDICDDEATLDVIETEMASRGITQAYIDEQRGAAEKQMLDEMKLLRQEGEPLDTRQPDGSTYLHVAAANGYYDVAAFLLRCGVSPCVRDNDLWMPVHAAACWAQPDLIELLCEYGGDINAKTNNGETPLDLCEDSTTRAVIVTVQQQEARKKRLAFGVRDSRRQSRKRKKFESPQQPTANSDNPFSARGAIRRLSLRDRSGMTLARLEAQKEQTDLLRSWSKEDVSGNPDDATSSICGPSSGSQPDAVVHGSGQFANHRRDSPNKKVIKSSQKTKPMSPDEWLRKLDKENGTIEDDDEPGGQLQRGGRARSSQKKKKKSGSGSTELTILQNGGDTNGASGSVQNPRRSMEMRTDTSATSRRHDKNTCCCSVQ
uniref:ANK_REP_REGION domain-containing protein n=2 Tax=Parascaris univalens TaxID=6257 RepID=A0A915BSP5_PARUN